MEQIEKALARAREMRSSADASRAIHGAPTANGIIPNYSETIVMSGDKGRIDQERLVADSFGHPACDIYGLLRTQVLQRMKRHGFSTIAITGPKLGCGASTTAANLAIAIALDVNQTVLLVDLNLRAPSLHRKFKFEPNAGIDDYLHGKVHLKDCLVSPGISRLVLLPARQGSSDAADIISSPRMTALAKEVRGRYPDRIIIYDAPPLLTSSDTLGFLPNVDAVLLVARSGRTTKQEIEKSATLLNGKMILGTLLNAHGK
jgi:protein-tyrosine kinase